MSYNGIGNPTIYRGGGMTWTRVNQMTQYGNVTYTYGADGVRISKGNTTYKYDGDKLLSEQVGSRQLQYIYGLDGIIGFVYNTIIYYYEKNLQGDVIALKEYTRNTGEKKIVARYVYDAYGNHRVYDENGNVTTNETFIGNINPIRYRSYYYDEETGLYYVANRYYDPEIGRFISPNSVKFINPSAINGLNLYSSCGNNPVLTFNSIIINRSFTSYYINDIYIEKKVQKEQYINLSNNYFKPHWKNKWLDVGTPGFLVIDNEGFQLINIGLSIYKGSFYFDNNENHSLNISLGNAGAYAGINYKKGIGVSASANVVSVGYDGRILDVSFELLSVGATYMYKDGRFKFGYGAGWYGFTVSLDFIELYKIIFGE